ncbi:MAG: FecR family protein [Spirochaetales bacterium]|uniref:FecR family protein n=1 Tax=Candidatus Thalassospirochaeta sargassi TaxID=3119039 RepID=A0AAJ1MHR9_9SPIO|nr:FecR family protein [Spirochaetales bacterium]
MNCNKKIFTTAGFVLALFIIFAAPLTAQNSSSPTAFLVYYDDDFELEVFDSTGDYVGEVFMGMELFPGSTIKTYNTSAEIQLDPNGSILKISENSVFQIEAFQTSADESNDFSLFNGKLRVIAARAGLGYENYSIITQSAVCGVRGTDFVIDSIGVVAVNEGKVEFSSLLSGETLNVSAGQLADVFAETFQATAASAQSLSSIFSGMDFRGTDPAQVPGHTVKSDPAEQAEDPADDQADDGEEESAAEDGSDDEQPADDAADDGTGDPDDDGEADETPSDGPENAEKADDASSDGKALETTDNGIEEKSVRETPQLSRSGSAAAFLTGDPRPDTDDQGEDQEEEEETEEDEEPTAVGEFFDNLFDMLGFEIGSILIDGETYAKAVIQPEFEIGEFRAKLYLPVIYQDNLFDWESWYWPAENNEWSFGTDQEGTSEILFDIMSDLFLKINYLQWGDNGDDFYFKFGNLDNMTIGYGILMRDFSNNIEFPAVRKVGINTGVTFEKFGFEGVLDDAADPTIFGGRLVYIPGGEKFPLAFGLSGITDINPDSEIEDTTGLFDPLVLNGAFDIGLPIDPINLTFFAEAAGFVLYEDDVWHWETIYNSDQPDFISALNNYGLIGGFFGNILNFEYRLEYRFSKGVFTPSFYANDYLTNKTSQYYELLDYIAAPLDSDYQEYTMGIYGDLSINLFDAVKVGGGYYWPWSINDDGSFDFSAQDSFSLTAMLMEDVIPVLGLYGSVSYSRTGLVDSIQDAVAGTQDFQLFDSDTIFSGELVYPFDDSLDIALQFATTYERDDDGDLVINDDGTLNTSFAMSVDMRVSF